MKFLMISSYLPSVLNFRGKLLAAIQSKGFEIHIIAPDLAEFPDQLRQLQQLGYHVHAINMQRTGTNPIQDLKTCFALWQCIKKIKPDYMLAYTIKPVIYGGLAAWLAKVPQRFALITGLGYAFQNVDSAAPTALQKLVYHLYAQALKHATRVFFQNPDDLALFQRLNLLAAHTATAVVNGSGVNVREFDVVALPCQPTGQPKAVFLMIARLLGDKGVREYAQAARRIKAHYPDAEFHLVGWIDDNPAAIEASELDSWISENILHYWGKLSDVKPAIAACSVYVLPSYREGTPRTVLEAMAMGRAIITTDAPGCRETVIDGKNGYLVAVKSVDDLVVAMQSLIENPMLISSMGQCSREIALNKYDVEQVNQQMLDKMGIH
ncbi:MULTISPECIES: glycosyltransferase family 4 protein [unclassified Acinetobacter]|uniref:glycosyltransferase family 4 protein n=1 Tax=unclassified Acinetobacter TaxID=196816 RepID=UPI0029341F24|nr:MULTISPECIES: glycosyltransferase family 4 protein [unclassified Acinetobacter]WOE30888.1 glycosyltransferase family 4 protein [Acinetobacter sp. SAAs470]WOE39083.1 glycosyltransferase family 4 protein [Acinetobacter sp. SAAs474]